MNLKNIKERHPEPKLNSDSIADNSQVSPTCTKPIVSRSAFRSMILNVVNVPVERIAFRKDKWGELATVYFANAFPSTSIGEDYDDYLLEGFLATVGQGSRGFMEKAKEHFGKDWQKYVRCRS